MHSFYDDLLGANGPSPPAPASSLVSYKIAISVGRRGTFRSYQSLGAGLQNTSRSPVSLHHSLMGNLVWHDLSRLVSVAASTYAVWASFWGMLFRKFFWDFVAGILRNPGGIQPSPKARVFITVIVKYPIVQLLTMILGFAMIALDYPLPSVKGLPIHRSIPLRMVLLFLQSFFAVLFYQGTNASLWSLVAVIFYARAFTMHRGPEGGQGTRRPGLTLPHQRQGVAIAACAMQV